MKILRVFCAMYLCFCIVLTISFGAFKIKEKHNFSDEIKERKVINVWHVESFSSGFGSKKNFLLEAIRVFEKKHTDVLINLTCFDVNTIKNNIDKNILPDVISFSYGLEILPNVTFEQTKNDGAGRIGDISYARVWCKGSYFLISKNKESLSQKNLDEIIIVERNNTFPAIALVGDYCTKKINYVNERNAVKNFIDNNFVMLATETEVVKLENLNENFFALPITNFNDRLQFISITSLDTAKQYYSKEFAEFLFSKEIQEKLIKINMYSNYFELSFDSEKLNRGNYLGNFNSIPLFDFNKNYEIINNTSTLAISGDENAKNKLKKIIVSS